MRGKPVHVHHAVARVRIIPAHAGQTRRRTARYRPNPDHPRACGANAVMGPAGTGLDGSSPRMRGKPDFFDVSTDLVRIIPAHAGQTPSRGSYTSAVPDHPRACGANAYPCYAIHCLIGSSPRMRGKPTDLAASVDKARIIPAHAGQTP